MIKARANRSITKSNSFFIERKALWGGKYQHVICLYCKINPQSRRDWWVESNVACQTKKQRGVYYNRCSLKRQMLQTGSINLPLLPRPEPASSPPPRPELLFTFHYLIFFESRCLKRNPFAYCVSFLNRWRTIVKLNIFRLFIFVDHGTCFFFLSFASASDTFVRRKFIRFPYFFNIKALRYSVSCSVRPFIARPTFMKKGKRGRIFYASYHSTQ